MLTLMPCKMSSYSVPFRARIAINMTYCQEGYRSLKELKFKCQPNGLSLWQLENDRGDCLTIASCITYAYLAPEAFCEKPVQDLYRPKSNTQHSREQCLLCRHLWKLPKNYSRKCSRLPPRFLPRCRLASPHCSPKRSSGGETYCTGELRAARMMVGLLRQQSIHSSPSQLTRQKVRATMPISLSCQLWQLPSSPYWQDTTWVNRVQGLSMTSRVSLCTVHTSISNKRRALVSSNDEEDFKGRGLWDLTAQ